MNCKGCVHIQIERDGGVLMIRCKNPETHSAFRNRVLHIAYEKKGQCTDPELLLQTAPSGLGRPAWCAERKEKSYGKADV